MIRFRDFVPLDTTRTLALTRSREDAAAVLARANAWIGAEGIAVLNVETVLLPVSTAEKNETGFHDNIQLDIGGLEIGSQRLQVIRVWYRAKGTM